MFFCYSWKIYLTHIKCIIPETLRNLHYGGYLITIMIALNKVMMKGLRNSTDSFVPLSVKLFMTIYHVAI